MDPSLSRSTARQPPATIGRIEIVCPLGEGGMARVFLGVQRGAFDATKLVVVKQVRHEFAGDDEFLAMFVNEARLALRFNHPNVVHTYEVIAEAPDYCLIMEYLEGQTLSQILRRVGREHFPLDQHVWILSQVLSGLSYAHELRDFDGSPLGVVHRDVSPSNIFVTAKGEVKLLDFGIAKAAGAISLTRQGVMKGKLGYAAPEQCMAQPSDARSDLFAVGVMLWEAIAQQRRTVGESELAALRARVDGVERTIEQVVPNVCAELAEACRRSVAHDPAGRFGSAREFQRCLDAWLATRNLENPVQALSEIVRQNFWQELSRVRQAIEARVGASVRTPPRAMTETASSVSPKSVVRSVNGRASIPAISLIAIAPNRRRVALSVVAGACAVAAAALGLSRLTSAPSEAPAAGAQPAVTPSSTPQAAAATSLPARRSDVRVVIAASPENAELRLDGRPIDNPYRAELSGDEREHELVASLDGYVTEVRKLHLDRDLDLRVTLARQKPERAAVEAPSRWPVRANANANAKVAASPPERQRVAVADASVAPGKTNPSSHTAAAAPQPGVDLSNTRERAPRAIDEKDPYSQ
jgi:serine/threonine-protein kinase